MDEERCTKQRGSVEKALKREQHGAPFLEISPVEFEVEFAFG